MFSITIDREELPRKPDEWATFVEGKLHYWIDELEVTKEEWESAQRQGLPQ